MQAIIFSDNEYFFRKLSGLTLLEHNIFALAENNVIKTIIISEDKTKVKKIIDKYLGKIACDLHIVSSYKEALDISIMDSYIIRDCTFYKSHLLKINQHENVVELGETGIYFTPFQYLKKSESFENIKRSCKVYDTNKNNYVLVNSTPALKKATRLLVKKTGLVTNDFAYNVLFSVLVNMIAGTFIKHSLPLIISIILTVFFALLSGVSLFLNIFGNYEIISPLSFMLFYVFSLAVQKQCISEYKTSATYNALQKNVTESYLVIYPMTLCTLYYLENLKGKAMAFSVLLLIPVFIIASKYFLVYIKNNSPSSKSERKPPIKNLVEGLFTLSSAVILTVFLAIFKRLDLILYITFCVSSTAFIITSVNLAFVLYKNKIIKDTYKNIKACLFDFDGTLVDDMQEFADLAAETIGKYYGTSFKLARRRYVDLTGIPFVLQMAAIFPGGEKNAQVVDYFETNKEDIFFNKNVEEGVKKTLVWLKSRGFKIAVSSGGFKEMIDEFCKKENILFDEVLGYEENFEKGPQHFQYLLDKFKLEKNQLLFCGDSLKDAEKGINFGIKFIGIAGTFSKKSFRDKFNSIKVIDGIPELEKILN
jgi:phosphoglycolate phosphatase-like HAD superfamily hydrolase